MEKDIHILREQALEQLGPVSQNRLMLDNCKKVPGGIAIVDIPGLVECLDLAGWQGCHHVLQYRSPTFDMELAFIKELLTAPPKLSSLETVLKTAFGDPVNIKKMVYKHPREKYDVLDDLQEYFGSCSGYFGFRDEIMLAAHELILNTLYDAPRVKVSSKDYNVNFPDGKSNELVLLDTATVVGVFARDPFGTLDVDHVLARLKKVAVTGYSESMNFSEGGAGIGLSLALSSLPSIFLGCKKGIVSVVGFFAPKGVSRKKVVEPPKSIHIVDGVD